MPKRTVLILAAFIATALMPAANAGAAVLYQVAVSQQAFISNPHGPCSATIGNGGNVIENGVKFSGKCEGPVLAPSLGGNNDNYVRFKTDVNSGLSPTKTRVELAILQEYFPFRENLYLGFRVRIPSTVDAVDGSHFILQLWQKCGDGTPGSGAPPIAGIRIKDGTTHQLGFFTKDDFGNHTDLPTPAINLIPDQWHEFVVMYNVNPRNAAGIVKIWMDGASLNQPGGGDNVYNDSFGYFSSGSSQTCTTPPNNGRPPQEFRVKFGIYKDTQPGELFVVHYDDFKVGEYYSNVKPW